MTNKTELFPIESADCQDVKSLLIDRNVQREPIMTVDFLDLLTTLDLVGNDGIDYLGEGIHGVVFKARIFDLETAIKLYWGGHIPEAETEKLLEHLNYGKQIKRKVQLLSANNAVNVAYEVSSEILGYTIGHRITPRYVDQPRFIVMKESTLE